MSNNNQSPTSQFQFYKIDPAQDNSVLINYVRKTLEETASHKASLMTPEFWRWQYSNSNRYLTGVYVVEFCGRIVGYYHVPVYEGVINGQKGMLAAIQDVAIDVDFRGQGVFRRLSTYANKNIDLQDILACYTFPNNKSIRTFLKYNSFTITAVFKTYVLPINSALFFQNHLKFGKLLNPLFRIIDLLFCPKSPKEYDNIKQIQEFDFGVEELFNEYLKDFSNYVCRNLEFLRWRYLQRPLSKYFCLGYYEKDKLSAVVIFKVDKIHKTNVLLLMDFAFNNAQHLIKLIYHGAFNSNKYIGTSVGLVLVSCCDYKFERIIKKRFWKVPGFLNPRRLLLLTRSVKNKSDSLKNPKMWYSTFGDWDVF